MLKEFLKYPGSVVQEKRTRNNPFTYQIPETFDFSPYEDILSAPEPSFSQQQTFYQMGADDVLNYFTIYFEYHNAYINFTKEFLNLNSSQRKIIIFNINNILPKYIGLIQNLSTINQLKQEIAGLIYNLSILETSPGNFY